MYIPVFTVHVPGISMYYLTCACKHAPTQTGVSVKGLDVESDVARDDVERVSHDRVLVGVAREGFARVVKVRNWFPMNFIQTGVECV